MNLEASRLRTFRNWPANAVVDARRIAKAGFYYMGQGLEVQCFCCGGRISEWNYGDKVMTRHRWLDPRCPFVINPDNSGNVPIESNSSSSSSSGASNSNALNNNSSPTIQEPTNNQETPAYSPQVFQDRPRTPALTRRGSGAMGYLMYQQSVMARLETFVNWPKTYIVTPESLARAGFYYTRDGDTVRCAFCYIMVGRWEEGDDPLTEHSRHNPDCRYLMEQLIEVSTEMNGRSMMVKPAVDFASDGIDIRESHGNGSGENFTMGDLGVQSHKVPKHPKYSILEARLQTFVNWPGDVYQTPEDLAAAGFYYAGSGDQVRCFHCDGGLRMWDPGDDPWIEHARWYPQCRFIVLVKGQSYVNDVLSAFPPLDPEEVAQLEEVNASKQRKPNSVHPPRQLVRISEAELQDMISSPEAVAALQMGIELSRVKIALRQRAETGDLPYSSPEALINAALDVQLEEAPEPWSTPPSSPVRFQSQMAMYDDAVLSESDGVETDPEDAVDYPSMPVPDVVPIEPPSDDENCEVVNNEGDDTSTIAADRSSDINPVDNNHSEESGVHRISLEEENRRLKEARLCKICMDKEISIVFLPCGHLVTCVHCAHSLADCPVCRKEIKATVRTFLS